MAYYKESYVCMLKEPAECKYRIDGKMSWVNLCGGNSLMNEISSCELRLSVIVAEDIKKEQFYD